MLDLTHGFLFFLIGCTVTVVGFFLAYLVATRHMRVKNEELTEVQKSLNKLHDKGQ